MVGGIMGRDDFELLHKTLKTNNIVSMLLKFPRLAWLIFSYILGPLMIEEETPLNKNLRFGIARLGS